MDNNVYKPMFARAIYLKGNPQPLENRAIAVVGRFLIVADSLNDTAPTWYNVDGVDRIEGAEKLREEPHTRLEQWLAIF